MKTHRQKRAPVISLTVFFLVLLSTGLSGYYVWQGFLHGFDKYLPIFSSTLLLDGLGVFALVFKVSFETRRRALVPFIRSLLLLCVCSIHLAALANMRTNVLSWDEDDARAKSLDDDRHARNVRDANDLVATNCAECTPERKRRMYQSEMARLEKAPVSRVDNVNSTSGQNVQKSWGRRYVEDFATAFQLIFGLACGLAMLVNNFLRLHAPEPAPESETWPSEIELKRSPAKRENFAKETGGFLATRKETAKKHASFSFEGLKRPRETLKDISFRLPGKSFKSYVRGDAVWVLLMKANQGTQETVASAKGKLDILDDAMTMPREAFRARLENFLRQNSFEI